MRFQEVSIVVELVVNVACACDSVRETSEIEIWANSSGTTSFHAIHWRTTSFDEIAHMRRLVEFKYLP